MPTCRRISAPVRDESDRSGTGASATSQQEPPGTRESSFQKQRIKRVRQQVFQLVTRAHPVEVGENHFQITAKFPQHLATRAAWGGRAIGVGDDRKTSKGSMAF